MATLVELHAEIEGTLDDGHLAFDCPVHGRTHRILLPIHRGDVHPRYGKACWVVASGSGLEDLTLTPSVHAITAHPTTDDLSRHAADSQCGWHGYVRNGGTLYAF